MDTLIWLGAKYGFSPAARPPIEIPNTNRETLAHLFGVLGFQRGAEIGVERGVYSEILCRENPGVELYCVDAWKAHRGYRDHVKQEKLDRFYVQTTEKLKPYPRATLVRKFSVDAARDFHDGSLDFVYIDANHNLQSVIADLAAWSPKVRDGGIIAGHDYAPYRVLHRGHDEDGQVTEWPNQIHVVQAVNAWTDAYGIAPWFLLGTKAKIEGQLRDDHRSYFWVHQSRPAPKPASIVIRQ